MRLLFPVSALVTLLLFGCGKRLPEVVPAGGRILLKKASGELVPMDGARLVLNPVAGEEPFEAFPVARANADGSFRLGTRATEDGAPEGDYVVTVEWKDRSKPKVDMMGKGEVDRGPDKLSGVYSNRATSPLRATVASGKELAIVVPEPGPGG